jgi:hypothetical protein
MRIGKVWSRATVVAALGVPVLLVCLFFFVAMQTFSTTNLPTYGHVPFSVADRPAEISPNAVPNVISEEELREILARVRPYVIRPFFFGRVPIGILIHALRLWGRESHFPAADPSEDNAAIRTAQSGDEMCRALLDHRFFVLDCEMRAPALLVRSSYGIRVLSSRDLSFSAEETMTHFGKLSQVMGEVGMPAETVVRTSDGYVGALREIIQDDAARLVPGAELEFVASGLAYYANGNHSWTNRFGQACTFDGIASLLMEQKPGRGTCFGCHVPHALVVLLRINSDRNMLSPSTCYRIKTYCKRLSLSLERCQTSDGAWPFRWPVFCDRGEDPGPEDPRSAAENSLVIVGHHLEWIALAPEDCRPSAPAIRQAARYLVRRWPDYMQLVDKDWHKYTAASHAARALWLISGLKECRTEAAGMPVRAR